MGLFQAAVQTYDTFEHLAGVERAGHPVLAPIGHTVKKIDIRIVIDQDGQFINASLEGKDDGKVLIPVTQESVGRTSAPCAHPLCDQLSYVARYKGSNYDLYVNGLKTWAESVYSHPIVRAVLSYVTAGTILRDLQALKLISLNAQEKPEKEKLMVGWQVEGIEGEAVCWKNRDLMTMFIEYYKDTMKDYLPELCYVTGTKSVIATQHSKGIIPFFGNAKLISANDSVNYTYRGRFREPEQSDSISYDASQKAHNALQWLIADQGKYVGDRLFLCWNPHGITNIPGVTDDFFADFDDPPLEPTAFKEVLSKTLAGYEECLPKDEKVIIAAFDAATPGRLAITYYNELLGSDFLDRLAHWESTCAWFMGKTGIHAPLLKQIVHCAFGTEREERGISHMVADDRVLKQQLQHLMACRIDRALMPKDIKDALVQRCSQPLSMSPQCRRMVLNTACAVIRKYDYDHKGVKWEMALEENKHDLSYQYGRLLAVMEKIELDTYDSQNSGRETNAIRMQSIYVQRPQYASTKIMEQLNKAYKPRLPHGRRVWYEQIIGQIYAMIAEFPDSELNNPLKDSYLMGYYLQRNAFYTNHTNDEE